ncbi:MAG: type IV pilus modification PilV family protein [Mycobacteriales bacterium]
MIVSRLASHPRHDGGETLMEILVALVVMGIVVVGLVSGLTTVIVAGDTHRHLSDVEVVARQYGEAMVYQAAHPATATEVTLVGPTLTVSNKVGTFPSAPFFVAVDAEVLKVTATVGNVWTLAAAPLDTHTAGATVTYDVMDDACATPANLQPTYTVPSGAKFIAAPTVSAALEFFDAKGAAIAAGGCANYWQTIPPCNKFATPEHLTECDPALVRVTITDSTTAASPHQANTTTRVLIGRGNA